MKKLVKEATQDRKKRKLQFTHPMSYPHSILLKYFFTHVNKLIVSENAW